MPETPIKTDTGTHPFDYMELAMIRSVCRTADDPDVQTLLNVDYAAHVMPAMAEKIDQLRAAMQAAEAKVRAIERIHVWTNEDRKQFLFADDVRAALGLPT